MKIPKGKLIPIGGNEAKKPQDELSKKQSKEIDFFESGVLKEVINEIGSNNARIEVITAASGIHEETAEKYFAAFKRFGYENVGAIHMMNSSDADSKINIQKLKEADGVVFSGGEQEKLVLKIEKSEFLNILTQRYYEENFVIAGTSAGAMAMASSMIVEGDNGETLLKGIVKVTEGLSLLPNVIIDTHFMTRGRLSRLIEALMIHPFHLAIGICEDTGLVISQGNHCKTIGAGIVMILDASEIGMTNYPEAIKDQSIFVENLKLHTLASGASFLLKEKKFLSNVLATP
jgi:cyanophycinase